MLVGTTPRIRAIRMRIRIMVREVRSSCLYQGLRLSFVCSLRGSAQDMELFLIILTTRGPGWRAHERYLVTGGHEMKIPIRNATRPTKPQTPPWSPEFRAQSPGTPVDGSGLRVFRFSGFRV